MEIRLAGPEDAGALAELAAETFPLASPPAMSDAAIELFVAENLTEERFAGYLTDPGRALLIAREDGRATGYSMLVFGEPHDRAVADLVRPGPGADPAEIAQTAQIAELSKIYVRADGHGTGLGKELMVRSLDVARERGATVVWLGTNQHNERGLRFYAKTGFEVVGSRRFLVGYHLEDDFVLSRALTTTSS